MTTRATQENRIGAKYMANSRNWEMKIQVKDVENDCLTVSLELDIEGLRTVCSVFKRLLGVQYCISEYFVP